MKYVLLLPVLLLLTPSASQASHDGQEFVQAVGIGATLGAVGYGLYKLGSWLFTETDEQVVQEAHRILNHSASYDILLGHMIPCINSIPAHTHLHDHLDTFKQTIVGHYLSGKISLYNMRSAYDNLQLIYRKLSDRIAAFERSGYAYSATQSEMYHLRTEVKKYLDYFACSIQFLEKHQAFFRLCEIKQTIWNEFTNEVANMPVQIVHDQYAFWEYIRTIVLTKSQYAHYHYPFAAYYDQLDVKRRELSSALQSFFGTYGIMDIEGDRLLQTLNAISQLVATSDVYRQELRDREHARVEQARLDAERAHAKAAQAQAWAMQNQAWYMADQNYILSQKVAADRERNRILKQQQYNCPTQTNIVINNNTDHSQDVLLSCYS